MYIYTCIRGIYYVYVRVLATKAREQRASKFYAITSVRIVGIYLLMAIPDGKVQFSLIDGIDNIAYCISLLLLGFRVSLCSRIKDISSCTSYRAIVVADSG